MADFHLKAGDLLPALTAALKDGNGSPIDLTGATVTFRMRKRGATALTVDAAASVVSAAAGTVRYDWLSGDTDTHGLYDAEFRCELTGGRETVPNDRYITVRIQSVL
jgi:hypothetical protein